MVRGQYVSDFKFVQKLMRDSKVVSRCFELLPYVVTDQKTRAPTTYNYLNVLAML